MLNYELGYRKEHFGKMPRTWIESSDWTLAHINAHQLVSIVIAKNVHPFVYKCVTAY